MPGPLDGVRVLEVASYVFVPAAAAVLAEFDGEVTELGRAPSLGADTDAVLSANGFDDAAIADLRARGIVG